MQRLRISRKENEKQALKAKEELTKAELANLHRARAENGYALGWGTRTHPELDIAVIQHAGSNTMWFSLIIVVPDKNIAAIAATNAATDEAKKVCADVVDGLLEQLAEEQK